MCECRKCDSDGPVTIDLNAASKLLVARFSGFDGAIGTLPGNPKIHEFSDGSRIISVEQNDGSITYSGYVEGDDVEYNVKIEVFDATDPLAQMTLSHVRPFEYVARLIVAIRNGQVVWQPFEPNGNGADFDLDEMINVGTDVWPLRCRRGCIYDCMRRCKSMCRHCGDRPDCWRRCIEEKCRDELSNLDRCIRCCCRGLC